MEARREFFNGLARVDRRSFLKISAAAAGAAAASGLIPYHSFQPVAVAAEAQPAFKFAYISDSHLYEKHINDRFVRSLLRAVEDVNALDPQPDFVLYGGDLAQLGRPKELKLGAEILKGVKAPLRMMVGEHDWYLDLGAQWRELFGAPTYSFDHKGVHFVTLNSVVERDFWTARGLTPMQRMMTVAGLDNGVQSPFRWGRSSWSGCGTIWRGWRRRRRWWSSPIRRSTSSTRSGTSGPTMPRMCRRCWRASPT